MDQNKNHSGLTGSSSEYLWGIDLGGTKIEGIVFHRETPLEPLSRHRLPTLPDTGDISYKQVLNQIQTLISHLVSETGLSPSRIGIGTPGTLDADTGLIRGSNSEHLNGKPLDRDLTDLLNVPIEMENDANCFALAETRLGAARQIDEAVSVVFGVIMGTGVGGGLVVNGNLHCGRHAIAGEWGHNFLDTCGGRCYCGRIGCVETVISGPALESHYQNLTKTPLSLAEIVKSAAAGDASAKNTINHLCQYFGKAVGSLINILDPDVIVIGGGVGNVQALYNQGVHEVTQHVFSPNLKTRIVPPKLGDSAGVYGAAYLVDC